MDDMEFEEPVSGLGTYTFYAVIMIGVLAICGILGNALVIYIFSMQKEKLSSTIFIITLAIKDLLVSLITMPTTIAMELLLYKVKYDFICKFYMFMKESTIPLSSLLMVAIAVDRYLIIAYPLKNLMTTYRARNVKIIVLILAIIGCIIGTLAFLMQGIYQMNGTMSMLDDIAWYNPNVTDEGSEKDYESNSSLIYMTMDSILPNDEDYNNGICTVSFQIFGVSFLNMYQKVYCCMFAFCAVVVTMLYVLICKKVINQRRQKIKRGGLGTTADTTKTIALERMKNDCQVNDDIAEDPQTSAECNQPEIEPSELNPGAICRKNAKGIRDHNLMTTLTFFIVAFVFIIAFTPACLMTLNAIPFNVILYYLHFVYNVANPFVYVFLNKTFRSSLRQIFRCRIQTMKCVFNSWPEKSCDTTTQETIEENLQYFS